MSDLQKMLEEADGKLTREQRIATQIEKAKRLLPYDWRAFVGDLEYLLAQLAEARAVLKEVEWGGEGFCILCFKCAREFRYEDDGHAPDCRLKKALEGS